MKSKRLWIILGSLLLVLCIGGAVALQALRAQQGTGPVLESGEVTQITAVTSVESSGAMAPQQSGSVFWQTTGTVGQVHVTVGDTVKKGDVLMSLDPATAPQNVIMAQADLISARQALDELLNPTDLAVANARQALADAQDAYDVAQRNLKSVENPVGQSLFDAIDDAKLALDQAVANQQLTLVGDDRTQINTALNNLNQALSSLQALQTRYDECIKISCAERVFLEPQLKNAQNNYNLALDTYNTAKLRFDTNNASQSSSVEDAQEAYDQAVRNLSAAQAGPNAIKLSIAQAKLAVAEANLNDAQKTLDELTTGADPQDVEAAQARVMAAQATVDTVQIVAPFDGEVVQVNYQPGDSVQQSLEAVRLADRSKLHVDVSVDESDVSTIEVGDPVSVTLDSLPDLTLTGQVVQINPLGTTTQGLVRYTVRVDLVEADPRVLIGMTANVTIVTNTDEGALAVPLDAVQLDQQGEYVNRVGADGTLERVNVVSGEVQDELVVVSGPLSPGDKVQMVDPVPVNSGAPFGPG